jgi:hypothetical protein
VNLYAYLDDILIVDPRRKGGPRSEAIGIGLGSNRLHYQVQPDQVRAPVNLQLRVHWGKNVYGPKHSLSSPKHREAMIACIKIFLRMGQYKPAHQFLCLLGLMASCLLVVKWVRLFMRPIQWHVKDR